jgi:hypothetical protein
MLLVAQHWTNIAKIIILNTSSTSSQALNQGCPTGPAAQYHHSAIRQPRPSITTTPVQAPLPLPVSIINCFYQLVQLAATSSDLQLTSAVL